MLSSRDDSGSTVTCVACGVSVERSDAREYDKYGDRWERKEKSFEHLCKPCHRSLCHQPRDGLESVLVECDAGESDRETFLGQFLASVDEVGEPER